MMRAESMLLILLLFFILAGVSSEAREVTVAVSGSSTVMPMAELAAEEFNMMQDTYTVNVKSGGSGVGIVDVAEGRSDIAMSSREIQLEERQRYESPTVRFIEQPVGFDAICLVVSPAVYDDGVTALTKDEVKQIYSGVITNWEELGGPNTEIFVIGRRAGSGTRDTFNEIIMGSREAETPAVSYDAGESSEVKFSTQRSDNAIGYMGYSFVMRGDTKVISLDGVEPTIESIKRGAYPLARKLYFVTLGVPSPGAKAFIDYILSPGGQHIAMENGFIPI
ncbi:MAG: PstS family phosphate ABC transporter substrate-binding protein [Methanothrix sp.]|nr:PstS family phosphate ABC transporter substrate-binding protein [Methanothrix sp.]